MKHLLTILTLATIFFAQVTYAQENRLPVNADGTLEPEKGFVSCSGSNCSACDFVVLGNTAIKWLITISFLFFAVLAFRAGIKLVTSQGNSGALEEAKSAFTNAFIGLIIILLAFLLVDTIMRQLVKGNGTIEGYGPWSEVKCAKQVEPTLKKDWASGDPAYTYRADSSIPIISGLSSGNVQQRILAATLSYRGSSTAAGPQDGRKACVWAVNNILRNAGLPPFGSDAVVSVENEILGGRGSRIPQTEAVGGDFVIVATSGGNHIGVCLNQGCTRVLSNSSSRSAFVWESGPDFSPSYSGGVGRIYRITR